MSSSPTRVPGGTVVAVLQRGSHRVVLLGERHSDEYDAGDTFMVDAAMEAAAALERDGVQFQVLLEGADFAEPRHFELGGGAGKRGGHSAAVKHLRGGNSNISQLDRARQWLHGDDIARYKGSSALKPSNVQFHCADARGEYSREPLATAARQRTEAIESTVGADMMQVWEAWEDAVSDLALLRGASGKELTKRYLWWSPAADVTAAAMIDGMEKRRGGGGGGGQPPAPAFVTLCVFGGSHVLSLAWLLPRIGFKTLLQGQEPPSSSSSSSSSAARAGGPPRLPKWDIAIWDPRVPLPSAGKSLLGDATDKVDVSADTLAIEHALLQPVQDAQLQLEHQYFLGDAALSACVTLPLAVATTRNVWVLSIPQAALEGNLALNSDALAWRYGSMLLSEKTPTVALLGQAAAGMLLSGASRRSLPYGKAAFQDAAAHGITSWSAAMEAHRISDTSTFLGGFMESLRRQAKSIQYLQKALAAWEAMPERQLLSPETMLDARFITYLMRVEAAGWDAHVPLVFVTRSDLKPLIQRLVHVLTDVLQGLQHALAPFPKAPNIVEIQ